MTFSQGREVFNGRGRVCLYAVSGIINKVNEQNIIRRLKLVPGINPATSFMPYFSGTVKKRFCERSNFPLHLLIRCALI